jgi:dihydroorotase
MNCSAAEAGFLPDTLSTDMTTRMAPVAGFGQATLGTYLLAVGVALPDVVGRMTVRPAGVAGLAGESFVPGEAGDVTVLRVIEGPSEIVDVDGRTRTVGRRLEAWATVRAGRFARVEGPRA